MRLPRFRWLAPTAAAQEKQSFLDLPSELRQEIYQYIFNDCIVRYHQTRRLSKRGKYVKVAYCHGPEQHRFLATCQKIYREAFPVLKASVNVLFDGGVDTEAAFYNVASTSMSPFLRDIILSTKKIVLSNPAEDFCRIRPNNLVGGTLPTFNSLEVVEIFGFYPKLSKWLHRNRPVHMGYPYWCWKIFGWESNGYATGCRKIHLTSAGDWFHAVTGRDVDDMTVFLNAWTHEKSPQRSDQAEFYVRIASNPSPIVAIY